MKTGWKKAAKVFGVAILVWVLWVLVLMPSIPAAKGRAIISVVQNQANQINGRALSKAEVDAAVVKMTWDFGLNQYTASVAYSNPTSWKVRLIPESRTTFMNSHSVIYRLIFLDFQKINYPEIVAMNEGHNQAPEATR